MIVAAVLVPHPPLLYRELAGAQDPAAALRAACRAAVARLVEGVERVVVVGAADVDAPTGHAPARPDVRRFGTVAPRDPAVAAAAPPLSLGVGLRLLEEAGWTGPVEPVAVPWTTTPAQAQALVDELDDPRPTGLLVLGEGSARRGQAAPGFLDDRAFPYDDALAAAVASGDAGFLAALDPGLAQELMVLGRAALTVLGAAGLAAPGPVTADLTYRDDPFGVTYLVALWSLA